MGDEEISQDVIDTSRVGEIPQKKDRTNLIIIGVFIVIVITASIVFFLLLFSGKNSKALSETITNEELSNGTYINLEEEVRMLFELSEEEHQLVLNEFYNNSADITISSRPISVNIKIGESKKFDLDEDGTYDILIRLESIGENSALFYIKEISEPACAEEWNCTEWSDCLNESRQRECTDLNDCGTEINKPSEKMDCDVSTSEVKNCGDDLKNLIIASENCAQANATLNITADLFGVKQKTTTHYGINGKDGDDCVFYLRIDQGDAEFSDELVKQLMEENMSREEIEERENESREVASSLVGKEGTCRISPENLVIFLNKMCEGTLSGGVLCSIGTEDSSCAYSGDWELFNDCEGDYFVPKDYNN